MNCPQCQEELKDNARFCSNCGLSFASFNTPTERADAFGEDKTLSQPDPLIGHVLDSKYELVARLGEGGMGAVYRARRVLIGDEVAVKVLLRKFVADRDAVERFRREARAAAMLRHPNVVTIHDFGEARGDDAPAYIVMELVEGESLRDLLHSEGKLGTERAVALMRDICAGVGAAHRRHIWHRDLKPDNVIVLAADEDRERETVKVVDFGIAKLRDLAGGPTLTQTGTVMGTPYYMSPEQCKGESLDARSDVYSLGAMLYEMLDGLPPFTAKTSTGVIAKHLTEDPRPLPKDAGVPPALEAVVMRALAKEPEERQADASTFSRELQAALKPPDVPPPARTIEANVMPAPQPTQPSVRVDQPLPKQQTPQSSDLVTPTSGGFSTDPISLSKLGLEPSVPAAKRRGSRLPLMFGIAALLIIIVGVVVWMTRTGADRNQASVNNNAPAEQPASGKANTPAIPAGMVAVPGGEFVMGRDEKDGGDEYERPAHKVTVKPFFIAIYEVTNEEYAKFVKATNHQPPTTWTNGAYAATDARKPVTGVSWDDANDYAKWAGKRLPTEEEWEFAARGTDGRLYPWGNEWRAGLANVENAAGGMADVGTYKGASPFGAFDMVGNAWEWTASDMKTYPGGTINAQIAGQNLKVIRGNMYKAKQNQATTTYRRSWPARGADYQYTGFRCAQDVTK
jgi:serine/threonine protein kinase